MLLRAQRGGSGTRRFCRKPLSFPALCYHHGAPEAPAFPSEWPLQVQGRPHHVCATLEATKIILLLTSHTEMQEPQGSLCNDSPPRRHSTHQFSRGILLPLRVSGVLCSPDTPGGVAASRLHLPGEPSGASVSQVQGGNPCPHPFPFPLFPTLHEKIF